MNRNKIIFGLILIGLSMLYIIGCSGKNDGEKYGEIPDEKAPKTAVGTIVLNPQEYIDKDVIVEGDIASECPSGGWINVKDKSGATIYVEMHGASFAPIPQKDGSSVVVKVVVYQTEGEP
ncbi:MAG: hypothetical protein HY934_06970, partial [Candidatus Firestonebacteria bacterium]|nr:hypothetical protein [Candidatus Firestonebacteria bacterium]